MDMKKTTGRFRCKGFWWRTMGFTKCHLLGVFIVDSALAMVGIALVFVSWVCDHDLAIRLLLCALCVFLLDATVLLSSILSLLFYSGSSDKSGTETDKSSEPSDGSAAAPPSEGEGRETV